jgi:hypothetical protein
MRTIVPMSNEMGTTGNLRGNTQLAHNQTIGAQSKG